MPKPQTQDTPPVTGQDPETLDDQGLESPVMGSGEDVTETPEGGPPDTGDVELEAYAREKGFKSARELVDYTRNLERKTTEQGQEIRVLRQSTFSPPQPAFQPPPAPRKQFVIPEDPYELVTDKDKFHSFLKDFREDLRAEWTEEQGKSEYTRTYNEAVALQSENPEEFDRLRPLMARMADLPAYRNLSISQLRDAARRAESEGRTNFRDQIVKDIFGPEWTVDQVRSVLPKLRPATISGSGGGGAPTTTLQTNEEKAKVDIRKRILQADKLES